MSLVVAVSLLLVSGPVAAVTPDTVPSAGRVLEPGDSISTGQRLTSSDDRFHLSVQNDGNVVLYASGSGRARWATGTAGAGATRLTMQTDGNLVLSNGRGDVTWASNTGGHADARLTLDDEGALTVSWPGGQQVLQGPDDRLGAGESLAPGQAIVSPQGRYRLVLQDDGNVVEVDQDGDPVWATGTSGDTRLQLDPSGDLVVRDDTDAAQWSAGTSTPGASLAVQDDGNIVLYVGEEAVWSRGDEERRRAEAADAAATKVAVSPGDDYPDKDAVACGAGVYCKVGSQYSARGFAYRNCTDFVAWKLGMRWSEIADGGNGHAVGWKQGWIERGRSVGTTPKVGSVAWWSRGSHGHVAYVVGVNADGSAVVEQYNAGGGGEFSTQTVRAEAYLY
jgi:surface antigen